MTFTAIRNGTLGADYAELSAAVIEDTDNTLVVIEPSKLAGLRAAGTTAYEPLAAEINAARTEIRKFLYQRDSDPVFFDYQRGEKEEQDWIDTANAIKAAWPYVE